jgi:hypothetical protein
MTYAKLKSLALTMGEAEQVATLKQLANDPRFAAVLKLILDEKEKASDDAALPPRAVHHGVLAHAAGSRFAMTELENRLRAVCTPDKPRRKEPVEPPEEN